jgi:hypothetical protein
MAGFEFSPVGIVPIGQGQVVFNSLPKDYQAPPVVPPTDPQLQAVASQQLARSAPSPESRPQAQPQAKPKPLTQRDIIKAARAELRSIEREIKRLQKLTKQRDALRRLLAAADNQPLAVVREFSRAAP